MKKISKDFYIAKFFKKFLEKVFVSFQVTHSNLAKVNFFPVVFKDFCN